MQRIVEWTPDRLIFREIFEPSPTLAWITEADGYCIYLNPSWYQSTGMPVDSCYGYGWLEALHPLDRTRVRSAFFEANDFGKPYNVIYQLCRPDGSYRPAAASASPRFDAGTFLGFFGTTITIEGYTNIAEQLPKVDQPTTPILTDREREVLQLIAHGNTSDTIGAMLQISPKTVDTHVMAASRKLLAPNRVSAIVKAVKLQEIKI